MVYDKFVVRIVLVMIVDKVESIVEEVSCFPMTAARKEQRFLVTQRDASVAMKEAARGGGNVSQSLDLPYEIQQAM